MSYLRTRRLLLAGVLMSGLLAGGEVDRALVAGPAWRGLGAVAWTEFSRRADLGPGLLAYPLEALGAALLLAAALLSGLGDRRASRAFAIPLGLALAFALAGLALTIKAAPIMLGLGSPQTTASAQQAFDTFYFWGLYLRGAAHLLAFAAATWALALLRPEGGKPPGPD